MADYLAISAIVGFLPLLFLIVTVVVLLKKLTRMILIALVFQGVVAAIFFGLSIENILISCGYGMTELWFWYYFIFVGIFFADLIMRTGAGRTFVNHLYKLEPNKYVLAVVLSGSLSSFLTSIGGGIGMPLTIPVTIYMLGMDPVIACAGMVTAFAWSMSYSGWGAAASTLLMVEPNLTASSYSFWGSILLIFPTILTQFLALHIYGGSIKKERSTHDRNKFRRAYRFSCCISGQLQDN